MAATKKPETETYRRERHRDHLATAFLKGGLPVNGASGEAFERVLRAATYAAVPGTQKRNAAYMIEIREKAFKAARRALARTKGAYRG